MLVDVNPLCVWGTSYANLGFLSPELVPIWVTRLINLPVITAARNFPAWEKTMTAYQQQYVSHVNILIIPLSMLFTATMLADKSLSQISVDRRPYQALSSLIKQTYICR